MHSIADATWRNGQSRVFSQPNFEFPLPALGDIAALDYAHLFRHTESIPKLLTQDVFKSITIRKLFISSLDLNRSPARRHRAKCEENLLDVGQDALLSVGSGLQQRHSLVSARCTKGL